MPQKRHLAYGYEEDLITGPLDWVKEVESLTEEVVLELTYGGGASADLPGGRGRLVQRPCHRRKQNEHKNLKGGQCGEQGGEGRQPGSRQGPAWA